MATSSQVDWQWLHHQQIIKYFRGTVTSSVIFTRVLLLYALQVAPIAIWVFDYLLTLDEEVRLMTSKGKWGITHALYIPARFFSLIGALCATFNVLVTALPQAKCVAIYKVSVCFLFLTILAAEGLLLIRTIALWNHDWRVRRALVITYCIISIVMFVCFVISDSLKFSTICGEASSPVATASDAALSRVTLGVFTSAALFELVVLALTILHGYTWRHPGFEGKLMTAVARGNLMYTSTIFLTSIVNITFFSLPPSDGWNGIITTFQGVLHGIVASRILFNLRDSVHNQMDDMTFSMSRLHFATAPNTSRDVESSR